jgi:hypothetical protein
MYASMHPLFYCMMWMARQSESDNSSLRSLRYRFAVDPCHRLRVYLIRGKRKRD